MSTLQPMCRLESAGTTAARGGAVQYAQREASTSLCDENDVPCVTIEMTSSIANSTPVTGQRIVGYAAIFAASSEIT